MLPKITASRSTVHQLRRMAMERDDVGSLNVELEAERRGERTGRATRIRRAEQSRAEQSRAERGGVG
eukprot:762583-Hanusia_phi.AAC.5